jgi:hypothetical protein
VLTVAASSVLENDTDPDHLTCCTYRARIRQARSARVTVARMAASADPGARSRCRRCRRAEARPTRSVSIADLAGAEATGVVTITVRRERPAGRTGRFLRGVEDDLLIVPLPGRFTNDSDIEGYTADQATSISELEAYLGVDQVGELSSIRAARISRRSRKASGSSSRNCTQCPMAMAAAAARW